MLARIEPIFKRRWLATLVCAAALAAPSHWAMGAELALKRVMLSSAGMGYFEYSATVDGNDTLALRVPLDQVDDVLKSLVILDSRGGAGSVRMAGREPLGQAFRDLPFNRAALNSPAAILNALQGAEIKIGGANAIQGRLLGAVAETTRLPNGLGTVSRHRVSIMTASGIRQFILEDAESVSFASAALQRQVDTALQAVAANRARDRRSLDIAVSGQGAGTVTVGYVISVPLWKTTYRVSLPQAGATPSTLFQGWAVIDNMSGQDWKDVELTLVSGSPVTFRQALYTAYYVDRPNVPVAVIGRVLPRVDTGAVAKNAQPKRKAERSGARPEKSQLRAARPTLDALARGNFRAMQEQVAAAPPAPAPTTATSAQAQQAATQVAFRLPMPVSAANGQTLMLPIVDRRLAMERVSLYQPATHRLHPLATIRLANDGKTGLPPGILTLYEQGKGGAAAYVGDAQIAVLPAGENRLVSYALDLRTRIDRESKQSRRIAKGRISRGVLELSVVDRQTTIYRVKAPAREDRRIVIEHTRRPGWELAADQTATTELTPSHYRIGQVFKAGSEGTIDVVVERTRLETIQLLRLSTGGLAGYAKNGELDPRIRASFVKMGELRAAIDTAKRRLADTDEARKRIFAEQRRIRDNLARIRTNTDLRRRYVAKLDTQETALERLEDEREAARTAVRAAEEALNAYVAGLEL